MKSRSTSRRGPRKHWQKAALDYRGLSVSHSSPPAQVKFAHPNSHQCKGRQGVLLGLRSSRSGSGSLRPREAAAKHYQWKGLASDAMMLKKGMIESCRESILTHYSHAMQAQAIAQRDVEAIDHTARLTVPASLSGLTFQISKSCIFFSFLRQSVSRGRSSSPKSRTFSLLFGCTHMLVTKVFRDFLRMRLIHCRMVGLIFASTRPSGS